MITITMIAVNINRIEKPLLKTETILSKLKAKH